MLLLDTHAFYWFICDDERMPEHIKRAIEEENQVFVSIGSFWEMAIKESIGKLTLPAAITELMETCTELSFSILPIRNTHLERLKALPWIHRDPFDRLFICQAQAEGLTLVTADENIRKYDIDTLW